MKWLVSLEWVTIKLTRDLVLEFVNQYVASKGFPFCHSKAYFFFKWAGLKSTDFEAPLYVRRNGRLAWPRILIRSLPMTISSSCIAEQASSASASTSISFRGSFFSSSIALTSSALFCGASNRLWLGWHFLLCLGCYFFNFIVLDGLDRGIVDIGSCIVDIGILIYCIDVVFILN